MHARMFLILPLTALIGAAGADEFGPSAVALIDASEEPGAAAETLHDAARRITDQVGVAAVVLLPQRADDGSVGEDRRGDVAQLLDEAQRQYEDFALDDTRATLEQASLQLDALSDPELGDLKIQIHWLQTQIAIVVGDTDRASSHVRTIARVAPWWEPPLGFLPPEVKKALLNERSRVGQDDVHVRAPDLAANAAVHIDGLVVTAPEEVALAAGRHVIRTERPGYVGVVAVVDLRPGDVFTVQSPEQPAWTDGQRTSLRTAMENQDDGDLAPLLGEAARASGVALVVVVAAGRGSVVRARLYATDPRGWVAGPGSVSAEQLSSVVVTQLPRVAPTGPRGPVQPLLTFEIGGGGRLVGKGQSAITPGGGLAVSFGGGIAIKQFLGVRALVAAAVHGPSPLPMDAGAAAAGGTQQGYLIRAGVEAAPRIPLGRGSFLFLAVSGGFAFGGVATSLLGAELQVSQATGGYFSGSLGLEHSPSTGLTVGPVVGYTFAGVPVESNLSGDGGTVHLSARVYSVLEVGLRMAIRPPG